MSSKGPKTTSAQRSEFRKLWSAPRPRKLVPGNPANVQVGQLWVTTDRRRNSEVFTIAEVREQEGRAIIQYSNGHRCFVRLDRFMSNSYGACQRGYKQVGV